MPTPLVILVLAWIDQVVDDAAIDRLSDKVAPPSLG